MSARTPEMRFLGLAVDADDRMLLGLESDVVLTRKELDRALERRLRMLDRHPARFDSSAQALRKRLNEIYSRFLDTADPSDTGPGTLPKPDTLARPGSLPQEVSIPTVRSTGIGITPFDRMILSILVASGGWNAASRGRITGLAALHSVHPKAMTRIMTGLSQVLRDGDLALPSGSFVADAASARRVSEMEESAQKLMGGEGSSPMMTAAMDHVSMRLSREFSGETPGSRIRILMACGVCAIVLIGLFTLALTVPSPIVTQIENQRVKQEVLDEELRAIALEEPPDLTTGLPDPESVEAAAWTTRPSLVGSIESSRADASLQALEWIEQLGLVARKASLPEQASDVSLIRTYGSLLSDGGSHWPLLDPALRQQLIQASLRPVSASSGMARARRLLDEIGSLADKDLSAMKASWRISWSRGLLAMVSGGADMPESLRTHARSLHSEVGPRRSSTRLEEDLFARSAGVALDAMIPDLIVRLENDREGASDQVEFWLLAQKALRTGALFEVAILDAVGDLLRERVFIDPSSVVVDLLARLLGEVEFSSRAFDPVLVRLNLMDWFEHEAISSQNLWLLGSLFLRLGDVTWWSDELILPPDGDAARRSEIADRIDSLWPRFSSGDRPRGVSVSSQEFRRLEAVLLETDEIEDFADDVARFHAIRMFGHLILALEQYELDRRTEALESLRVAESLQSDGYLMTRRSNKLFGEIGRSTTRDGGWAALWDRSRRDASDRLEALRELEGYEGGDLGVQDAAALAQVIFQGPTPDIRRLAQAITTDYFSEGPNVARALLDGFERPRRERATSQFIQSLSGRALPAVGDDSWALAARRQLVDHAFNLLQTSMHDIDRLAAEYTATLETRCRLRGSVSVRSGGSASSCLSDLVDAASSRLEGRNMQEPVPAEPTELTRRRAVRSFQAIREPQLAVAQLFSLMDLMCFETALLRPDLRARLAVRHSELTASMAAATNVLDQILMLQREIARLLLDRLEPDDGELG